MFLITESIEDMIKIIRSHVVEPTYESYYLFTEVDDTLLDDLAHDGIIATKIADASPDIYLSKLYGKTSNLVQILIKHNIYVRFEFNYKTFLEMAIFFIEQGFTISNLNFEDGWNTLDSRNLLDNFDVTKDNVCMTIWRIGDVDSTVNPTNYLRSFYTGYRAKEGVISDRSY